MILVALETSSFVAGIAVTDEDRVLVESSLQVGTVYAEQLPVMLERALKDADVPFDQVDGFAVSIGPGSYTGLRVGLSLAKGLAFTAGKPLVAVPTLDTIALCSSFSKYPVQAVLDAGRQKIYTAGYDTSSGEPERRTPYQATTLDSLMESVIEPVVFAGPGARKYQTTINQALGNNALFLPSESSLRAASVAFLGRKTMHRGEQTSLYEVEPMYIRNPNFARPPAQPVSGAPHLAT